jgi:AcrR family transcriptional regulator
MTGPPTRQRERSMATRRRLLDATVDCLVERGWTGTTTTEVCARAGVSRGAQLHHYPTKADLVAAAVGHLAERRGAELRVEAAARAGRAEGVAERVARTLDLLAGAFTGPGYAAALELWVAARTDPELRAALLPVEARLGREMYRLAVDLLGADESRPEVREAVRATLDLVRGMGVASLLTDDPARRRRHLATWADQLATILEGR